VAREMPSDGQISAMLCERSAENARAIATVAGVARFFGLYLSDACTCHQPLLRPLADAVSLELGAMGEPSTDAPRVTPSSAMAGA